MQLSLVETGSDTNEREEKWGPNNITRKLAWCDWLPGGLPGKDGKAPLHLGGLVQGTGEGPMLQPFPPVQEGQGIPALALRPLGMYPSSPSVTRGGAEVART